MTAYTYPYSILFDNSLMSDVMFFVGEEKKKIYAHKFVLSLNSKLFQQTFYGENWQNDPRRVAVVTLPDSDPVAFRRLLKFLYTGNLDLDINDPVQQLNQEEFTNDSKDTINQLNTLKKQPQSQSQQKQEQKQEQKQKQENTKTEKKELQEKGILLSILDLAEKFKVNHLIQELLSRTDPTSNPFELLEKSLVESFPNLRNQLLKWLNKNPTKVLQKNGCLNTVSERTILTLLGDNNFYKKCEQNILFNRVRDRARFLSQKDKKQNSNANSRNYIKNLLKFIDIGKLKEAQIKEIRSLKWFNENEFKK